MIPYIRITTIICSFFCIIACNKSKKKANSSINIKETIPINIQKQQGVTINHTKEFRYDYTVIGTDEKNQTVYGNINLDTELGEGKLTTHNDPSNVEVVVESNEEGEIIATDSNGNKYILKIK
ncbi:hypothetical protein [Flavobacterium sp.]|uniref:hypothetical protein n=1 Tax=Flavobacterium sp. TaxID=239 RepID=UPI003C567904